MIKILQDTTLPELVITSPKQLTKNIHRIVDSLYGKKYPFFNSNEVYADQSTTYLIFILQKGNYIFVNEVYACGKVVNCQSHGHLIVFNPTLSDSLPKVIFYEYNEYKHMIRKANDLVNESSGNNFKRQTPEEYKHEY